MAVLTRDQIIKNIEEGHIKIDPLDYQHIGPASVDLAVDNQFRTFKKINEVVDVTDETRYQDYTELITVKDHFLILPGEMVLGITRETISLAPHLCGRLDGRSRFARMGLTAHITAGFMQPGIANRQVLEIFNASPMPLKIHVGTRLCHFIFETCEGQATYSGRFTDQNL